MCSCDYFELTNYRCLGGEKDEFDQTRRMLAGKFVFSNEAAIEFAVKPLSVRTSREKVCQWRRSTESLRRNFYFSSSAVTLVYGSHAHRTSFFS
jgi:hypothetical protein